MTLESLVECMQDSKELWEAQPNERPNCGQKTRVKTDILLLDAPITEEQPKPSLGEAIHLSECGDMKILTDKQVCAQKRGGRKTESISDRETASERPGNIIE